MLLQLIGWGPDLDPTTPGVFIDCANIVPTKAGFDHVGSAIATKVITAVGYARSMVSVPQGANTHTVIAVYPSDQSATTCTLYEYQTATAAARGSYTVGNYAEPVIFRPFDGETIAARQDSPMKYGTFGSSFADVTGAPSCALVEATQDFVIAFNTAAGFDWHCSAIGNGHDWTLDVSTQCVRGKFFEKVGPIVAAGKVGEMLVAFTETQMWSGRYVGAPEVWQWTPVSSDIGCVGPEALAETPFGLCWIGQRDIYVYDGTAPRPLETAPVRKTIYELIGGQFLKHAQLSWDRQRGLVWVYGAPAADSVYTSRELSFCYHMESKMWGRQTWSDFRAANQAPDPLSIFAAGEKRTDGRQYCIHIGSNVFLSKDGPYLDGGVYVSGYFETGYIGDGTTQTMLKSVRPRFTSKSTNANSGTMLATSRKVSVDGGGTATSTATLDADFKYPFRQTGRWHSVRQNIWSGDIVSSLDIELVPMGNR